MKEQDKRLVEQEENAGFNPKYKQFMLLIEQADPVVFFVPRWCINAVGGDFKAGVLLSHIVNLFHNKYGKQRMIERDGKVWLVKSRNEWSEEFLFTPKEFDRAIKVLCDLGLAEKRIFKVDGNPTISIWLNEDLLEDLLLKAVVERCM